VLLNLALTHGHMLRHWLPALNLLNLESSQRPRVSPRKHLIFCVGSKVTVFV